MRGRRGWTLAAISAALAAVALVEGWMAHAAGLALPLILPLSIAAAAGFACIVLAIDTAWRRLRGPSRQQISQALELLRERRARDAITTEQLATLSRAVPLLAAEPDLRALEATLARTGAAIEEFDHIADLYSAWQADLAHWYATAAIAAPAMPSADHRPDEQAQQRARQGSHSTRISPVRI